MRPPRKILVLSITRLGDIVQSIPFFRRMRLRHPQAEIHVLVEDCFSDAAALLPDVDRIHTVRLEDLIPNLAAGRTHNLAGAAAYYRDLVTGLKAERFDDVWNLTHTRPAMVLNFLLAGERGRGVTLDGHGLQRVNSPWLMYFFATNLARPWCQFNLVDIYANCIGGVEWTAGRELAIPRDRLPAGPRHGRTRIAIHAGAAQKSKQWPLDSYRRVAQILVRRPQAEIVLVGGRRDEAMVQAFNGLPNLHSFIGQTSVPELAALLSSCDLLISNDSGPMHVAAAVGTPVIAVTLGSALGSETAPYGEGHLVVEPDSGCFPCSPNHTCPDVACAARIGAGLVAALAEWRLGWRAAPAPDDAAGARIYRTRFSTDDQCLELARVLGGLPAERDELHRLMRPAWLRVLEDRKDDVSPNDVSVPRELANRAAAALGIVPRLRDMAGQLARAAARTPLPLRTIENLGALVRAAESELAATLGSHGLLRSLLAYVTIARASLAANDLPAQAQETAAIYERLRRLLQPLAHPSGQTKFNMTIASSVIEESHEDLSQRS